MEQLRRWWSQDWCFLLFFGLLKLGIHLTAIKGYGFFRDEFYYLACGEHLAFGYVDHPPLVAVLTKLVRICLGDSIYAIRLLPVCAGIAVVCLTGCLARELGAKRFGQALAMTAVLVAPIYLGIHGFLSMNAFDHVFWIVALLLLTRIIKYDQPRLWIPFGLVVGFGLENKISVLFLGFGIFVGLILTPERRSFRDYRLWLGAGLAVLVFLPHLVWQQLNGWPTLEFMRNAQAYKHYAYKPWEFMWGALLEANPLSLPLLVGGIFFYFVSRNGKSFRLLGWAFVSILGLFLVQKAKTYYLAPALPILYAAGGAMMEIWANRHYRG